MNKLQDEISKIKMKTLAHQPFFGAGASKLLWVADEKMNTAATDGTSIKFNPDFLMSLSSKQQVGLVVHEILHVYGKHHIRGIGLDHNLHNIATDYWINLQIQDAIEAEIRRRGVSCMELPEGALLDEKYRGMSSDDIYKSLLKEQKQPDVNPRRTKTPQQPSDGDDNDDGKGGKGGEQQQEGDGQSPGDQSMDDGPKPQDWGRVDNADIATPEEAAEAEREVEVMVEQAHTMAKARGLETSAGQTLLEEYKKPSVDWKTVIRETMQGVSVVDYTYQRSHKNMGHLLESDDIFIPDFHREDTGELVLAFDTSGSCSPDEVQQFVAEFRSICEELRPTRVHILQCSTRIRDARTFEQGEHLDIDVKIGGGTDFQPVFDWVDDMGIKPMALVYLTDGYSDCPEEPDYPVYWGVTSERQGHLFGEVMSIKF
jgi:predicted metal-dependent peptidase